MMNELSGCGDYVTVLVNLALLFGSFTERFSFSHAMPILVANGMSFVVSTSYRVTFE
jgi:hypothetical protein